MNYDDISFALFDTRDGARLYSDDSSLVLKISYRRSLELALIRSREICFRIYGEQPIQLDEQALGLHLSVCYG